MSQIYNGTFLLGDTSATTLSAGPGIKLDTSVPGTIKISNDETVLYSGECLIPSANLVLSEPASAFEHTIFYYTNNDGFQNSVDFIPKTGVDYGPVLNTITQWSNGNTYFKTVTTKTPDTQTYSAWTSGSQIIINSTGAVSYGFNNTNLIKIQKVIGINRISGGN